jgi:hypothetical protein
MILISDAEAIYPGTVISSTIRSALIMWLEEAGNISCANGILGPTPIFVVVNIIP